MADGRVTGASFYVNRLIISTMGAKPPFMPPFAGTEEEKMVLIDFGVITLRQ